MMNKKIQKLYDENYSTPQLPMRTFRNPFFLPSENQLLFDILNPKSKDLKLQTQLQPVIKQALFTPTQGGNIRSDPFMAGAETDNDLDDDDGFDLDTRDSVSMESDYYQNEVYKLPINRIPYDYDEIIDNELSSDRHLVAYNRKTNTLHISHRGTADILDIIADIIITRRDGKGDADRLDFSKTQFPLDELEKREITSHTDILENAIAKFGENVKLVLSGHSKGGLSAQMVLNYLDNNYKGKRSKVNLKQPVRAYVYNSAPYEWKGESNDPRVFPRRVKGDPISYFYGRNHPNLVTISKDRLGKTIPIRSAHSSNNFVENQAINNKALPVDKNIGDGSDLKLSSVQESNMLIKDIIQKINKKKKVKKAGREEL